MSTILSAKRSASDKGSAAAIPFFDNLPIAAIPAVQRLYDDVTTPGHNPLTAYSDFVSRLNAAGSEVPPRAIVKRWIAGVQGNLCSRPESHEADVISVVTPEASYFDSLPETAMPALSQLWDTVQTSSGSDDQDARDESAFDVFLEAMLGIGHREPQWRQFLAYVRAIRAGQVERPARQIAEEAGAPVPDDGAEEPPRLRPAASSNSGTPARNPVTQTVRPDDIALVVDRMLDDTIAQFQREARARAALVVAGRLRELADQLERQRA